MTGAKAEASVLLKGEYFPILDSTVISVQFPILFLSYLGLCCYLMFSLLIPHAFLFELKFFLVMVALHCYLYLKKPFFDLQLQGLFELF